MQVHPECGTNEVFVGNTSDGLDPYFASLSTMRLGNRAFDIDGRQLPVYYRPVIIDVSEYDKYDLLAKARFAEIRGEGGAGDG